MRKGMNILAYRDQNELLQRPWSLEFKSWIRRHMLRGLLISVGLHFALIGTYYAPLFFGDDDETPVVRVRILKYSELGPPPSISSSVVPTIAVSGPSIKPSIGIPVPVPDAEISVEQTIATQQELSQVQSPLGAEGEGGDGVVQDIVIEDEPGIDEFVPVERAPVPIKQVIPVYPEIARRSGLEGVVWVKILVDKEGRSKRAVVIKSESEIFNEPAVEAALQWKFTPAIMNRGPVSVWVAIPFHFRLSGRSS